MDNDHRLHRGRHTYGNPKIFGNKTIIVVGNFCSISDFAVFDAGFNHGRDYISQFPFSQKFPNLEALKDRHPLSYGDSLIGNDVWIGDRAFIRSGVVIGDGAIIGYGAVITKNVRPYAVMVGNPALEVGRRYCDEVVNALRHIAWWNWPDEKIIENADLLMSDAVDTFLDLHSKKT